jgi:hypothetical protein
VIRAGGIMHRQKKAADGCLLAFLAPSPPAVETGRPHGAGCTSPGNRRNAVGDRPSVMPPSARFARAAPVLSSRCPIPGDETRGHADMNFPSLSRPAKRVLSGALLLTVAAGAHAAPGDAVEQCVELAPVHQVVRSGEARYFLLKSGDDHYKVALRNSCGSLPTASRMTISAEGREGRLCPGTGDVVTPRERCGVGEVTRIAAEEFQRQQRRRR